MEREMHDLLAEISVEKQTGEEAKKELTDKKAEEERLVMEVDQLRRKEELVRAGLENEGQLREMEAERVKLM